MTQSTARSTDGHETAYDVKAGPTLLSAATISGDEVCNLKGAKLGTIQDIMLDVQTGRIRYAVLSSGGFLGMGNRLLAVPWNALQLDRDKECFVLDVSAERLKAAPGFDKDEWPNMADPTWNSTIETYYATQADAPRA